MQVAAVTNMEVLSAPAVFRVSIQQTPDICTARGDPCPKVTTLLTVQIGYSWDMEERGRMTFEWATLIATFLGSHFQRYSVKQERRTGIW